MWYLLVSRAWLVNRGCSPRTMYMCYRRASGLSFTSLFPFFLFPMAPQHRQAYEAMHKEASGDDAIRPQFEN